MKLCYLLGDFSKIRPSNSIELIRIKKENTIACWTSAIMAGALFLAGGIQLVRWNLAQEAMIHIASNVEPPLPILPLHC